jgi:hypothetical protein
MKRREFLAAAMMAAFAPHLMAQQKTLLEVWRAPTCGCCGAWVKHLEKNGFAVKVNIVADAGPVRRAAGIPDRLGSCHTAKVNGYVIEGHVPASDIRRLLAEKPQAPYDVLLVTAGGRATLFKKHG